MVPLIVGIIFLFGLFIFIYFIRGWKNKAPVSTTELIISNDSPLAKDIVLAEVTDDSGSEYAILWNYEPNKILPYSIINDNNTIVANGEISSQSSLYKLKGIPLEYGKTYKVKVGATEVEVPFYPVNFVLNTLVIDNDQISCDTTIMPSDIEVLLSGAKVPQSSCNVRVDPPGFICYPGQNVYGEIVIMIYNGSNVASILVRNLNQNSSETTLIEL